jgi:hypothetical protein
MPRQILWVTGSAVQPSAGLPSSHSFHGEVSSSGRLPLSIPLVQLCAAHTPKSRRARFCALRLRSVPGIEQRLPALLPSPILKRARIQNGTVVFNKRFGTWNYLWFEEGRRRSKLIGTIEEYKTREAALRASEGLRPSVHELRPHDLPTVRALVNEFRSEEMPERFSTRVGYDAWFNNHILPRWGHGNITAVQPRPVELWLRTLPLSPKSKCTSVAY